MFSVANLLDAAKEKASIDSDYRLAKVIGITHSVVSAYRHGKSMPNDKILAQICALSGDDVAVVAAQIQAERSQSPEGKTMWMMIAKRLSGGASTAILSVVFAISLIAGYAEPARAAALNHAQNVKVNLLYIV
jgi:predicted transcriptional regulator